MIIIFWAFGFLFVFCLVKGVYNFIRAIFLRIKFSHRLENICVKNQYNIKKERSFLASFFRCSDKPDLIVTVSDTDYLIRFVTCFARKRFYYFINPEYYVRSLRIFTKLPTAIKFDSAHFFACRKHIKALKNQFLDTHGVVKKCPVFLINPTPAEIHYLDKAQKCRVAAGNGVELDEYLIYSAKGFLDFLKSEIVL